MIAYKFLAAGGVGPFTRFEWPRPGPAGAGWVEARGGSGDERWIHACRIADLPYWLGAELWRVELADPVHAVFRQLASPRARLVERISAWDRAAGAEFAGACAWRARELALPVLPPAARASLSSAGDLASLAAAAGSPGGLDGDAAAAAELVGTAARAAERPALAGFALELLATLVGGAAAGEAERSRQARWLAERLGLSQG